MIKPSSFVLISILGRYNGWEPWVRDNHVASVARGSWNCRATSIVSSSSPTRGTVDYTDEARVVRRRASPWRALRPSSGFGPFRRRGIPVHESCRILATKRLIARGRMTERRGPGDADDSTHESEARPHGRRRRRQDLPHPPFRAERVPGHQ